MDPIKEAVLARATTTVNETVATLAEVQQYLAAGEELAALGALAGIGERLQYVETLLTVLRDLQPESRNHS
jgi:hypothetical protein